MDQFIAALKEHYDLEITSLSQQQGGWSAFAYKALTRNQAYFLKVYDKSRASTPKWTTLIDDYAPVLVWLQQHSGLKGKIPVPLLTKEGRYTCENEDGILLLYEYIDGETIAERELTKEQVSQLAEIISELHSYDDNLPMKTGALKESFDVSFLQQLSMMLNNESNPMPSDVGEMLEPHRKRLNSLIVAVEQLSAALKNSPSRFVLCHTDIHNWNLMQSGQTLLLIDWEGLKLAPVEADLMFLTDKPYYDDFLSIYRERHPNFTINPDALRFYQGRRKLEDIGEWLEQLLFDKQDAKERAATLSGLTRDLQSLSQ
ncbi:phosphotransferase family protein [Paenibacillus harenae]|uniref:phosphotransferase family protein n=1 Tax=Paenibacillus harenae TaxID=306543 RepID=UPI00041B01AA|nr:aminoglycoside phosphotransferase family protein [Paenibacillus harenae]